MKSLRVLFLEKLLRDEQRRVEAIENLLDEALRKVGYQEIVIDGLTIPGKISYLVKAAKEGVK